MRGRSTKDACDSSVEGNKDVYICFVDYEKAFDRVQWEKLIHILKKIGVDTRDRKAMWELYVNQAVKMNIDSEMSELACIIGCEVRQGGLYCQLCCQHLRGNYATGSIRGQRRRYSSR